MKIRKSLEMRQNYLKRLMKMICTKDSSMMNEMKNIFMSMDGSLNEDSSFVNVFEDAMNDISGVEEMFNNMEGEMSK